MGNEMFNDEQLAYLKDQAKAADLAAALVAVIDALRSLLAATPEPAAPRNGMDWSGTTGTVGPEPAPALPEEPLPLTGIATLYDVCTLREIAEALHARGERNRPNYLLSLALRIERALAARKHR